MKKARRACLLLGALLGTGPIIVAQEPRLASAIETDPQTTRVQELWSLIEGQNPPQTRRTGARELLRLGHATTPARVLAHLASPNQKPIKLALVSGLADLPEAIAPEYIDPLVALLGDADRELRDAAAAALAGCRDPRAVDRLLAFALDPAQTEPLRTSAVETLGRLTSFQAVEALGRLLDTPSEVVARASAVALEAISGQDFQQNPATALRWWKENRSTLSGSWERTQADRLARENRILKQRFSEVEQRLRTVLSDQFFRAAENDRAALLMAYLSDSMPVVRLAGLEIVRTLLGEQRAPPPEVIARVRDLLSAPEPAVREAAVRQLVALRDPSDGERLRQMLSVEENRDVRVAVIAGLGFVAGPEAAPLLLQLIADGNAAVATEAVRALGRLADRGVVSDPALRRRITDTLRERFAATGAADLARRETLLRAMSRQRDPSLAPLLAEGLRPSEPTAIREAAATGLAALLDPNKPGALIGEPPAEVTASWLVQTLAPAAADESQIVRRAAVTVVSALGSRDADLEVLWGRLNPASEPDEVIRQDAWSGVLRILRARPAAEIERWLARLTEVNGPGGARGSLDLSRLLVDQMERESQSPARLAGAWRRVAELSARLGALPEARSAYSKSLAACGAAQSPETQPLAIEALRFVLAQGLYDQAFGELLAGLSLDDGQLWAAARDECEKLMDAGNGERAAQAVARLSAWPPGRGFSAFEPQLEELRTKTSDFRMRARVDSALKTLRAKPDDAMAVQKLLAAGSAGVPAICDALAELAALEAPEPAVEQALVEILRALLPSWSGYPTEAAAAEKVRLLEEARRGLSDGEG